ncbi:hypothetical protein Syun_020867 [Stephania yunnanensis]|uniref:Uncharacterized protein n=1 Tax=Stephania yunnanensis TaxID=152371 RepID=A0AAP0NQF0_9MAGN
MDLSSLTQTNISFAFHHRYAMVLNTLKPLLQGQSLRSCVRPPRQEHMGWFDLMEHTAVLVDEMMTSYQD